MEVGVQTSGTPKQVNLTVRTTMVKKDTIVDSVPGVIHISEALKGERHCYDYTSGVSRRLIDTVKCL